MKSQPARPSTLEGWLRHIERVHPAAVALGLDRVAVVRDALRLRPHSAVITVGGTNGKGSACAFLEAMLGHAGYKVGCYTSPHLLRYNERVRIDRHEVDDDALCQAFDAVEAARGAIALTYFEFGTLAAVWLFERARVDVQILEVGLGGRLDAVNAFDADCALVTGVALDHMEYLGSTREQIGYEKAGIFRSGRPAVYAETDPPQSVRRHAFDTGATLLVRDADFGFASDLLGWRYWGPAGSKHALPHPVLRGVHQLANASACITVLDALTARLPLTLQDIRAGLLHADIRGRFQVLPGRPAVILDVAHNPQAAAALEGNLASMGSFRRTIAVFAMLRDKDITGVVLGVKGRIDHWMVGGIAAPRGADAALLIASLRAAGVAEAAITRCVSLADAYVQACDMATENDRIVAFGSFYTVGEVMRLSSRSARRPEAD